MYLYSCAILFVNHRNSYKLEFNPKYMAKKDNPNKKDANDDTNNDVTMLGSEYIGPNVLSGRNRDYMHGYALKMKPEEKRTLCGILSHPFTDICTAQNEAAIAEYGSVRVNGDEYPITSSSVRALMTEIMNNEFQPLDVLHDVTAKMPVQDEKDESLKQKVIQYLIDEGYISKR